MAIALLALFAHERHALVRPRWWRHRLGPLESALQRGSRLDEPWSALTSIIVFLAGSLLWVARGHPSPTATHQLALLTLCLIALLSRLWADNPPLTSERLIAFLGIGLGAALAGMTLTVKEAALFVTAGSALFLVAAIIEDLTGPPWPEGHQFRFGGALGPGKLAAVSGLLTLCVAYLRQVGSLESVVAWAVIAVAVVLMILTRSRGAMVALCASGAVGLGLLETAWTVWLSAAVVAAAVVLFSHRLREPSPYAMNGRIAVWEVALDGIRKRPIRGVGHGGFWNGRRISEFSDRWGWAPFTSHSVYVELFVNLGLLGLVTFWVALGSAAAAAMGRPTPEAGLVLMAVVFVAVQGILETAFILPNFRFFAFMLLMFAFAG